MRWAVVWNTQRQPGKPPVWRPWTDRLFGSRSLAWNAVLTDRGYLDLRPYGRPGFYAYGQTGTGVHRDALLRRERLKGLRVVPAWIDHLDPERYAAASRPKRRA